MTLADRLASQGWPGVSRMRTYSHRAALYSADPQFRMDLRGRLMEPYWRRRFAHFGERAVLAPPSWLAGTHHVSIGAGTRIWRGAWLAAEPATWNQPDPSLVIGKDVVVGLGVRISATSGVTLADCVTLAARITIIDSDHTWLDGKPQATLNRSFSDPIRVGYASWIAEQSILLKGTDIGAYCIVAANSVVRGTFPDFSVVAGSPAKVVGSSLSRIDPELVEAWQQAKGAALP
jgi:acetyltransferase-like isoleucine patch superfamily enzyme